MKRTPLLVALILGVLLASLTAWRVAQAMTRRADAAEATAVSTATPVEVLRLEARDLVDSVKVTGTLRALHEAEVTADVGGRVESILLDVGAPVTKGQVLARLDDTELALQVRQAEGALAAAKAASEPAAHDLAGIQSLREVGGVSDAQLVAAKSRVATVEAQITQADATLGLARARLADATIKAPFDGVVVRRATDIGRQTAPGSVVFGVADLSELELVVEVDDRIAAHLKPGSAVAITSDTVATIPDGEVKTVSPMLDASSHKAQVVIRLPYVAGLFGHGGATATFRLGQTEGTLAVPLQALVDDKGDHVVFVADGNVARRKVVNTGLRDGNWVEVTGLESGSSIIVTGNAYLSDGALISIRDRS